MWQECNLGFPTSGSVTFESQMPRPRQEDGTPTQVYWHGAQEVLGMQGPQ